MRAKWKGRRAMIGAKDIQKLCTHAIKVQEKRQSGAQMRAWASLCCESNYLWKITKQLECKSPL